MIITLSIQDNMIRFVPRFVWEQNTISNGYKNNLFEVMVSLTLISLLRISFSSVILRTLFKPFRFGNLHLDNVLGSFDILAQHINNALLLSCNIRILDRA